MKDYFVGLWEFIKAYVTTVSNVLTGSITVVSTFISIYASSNVAKIVFGGTAVLAFIASANELWQQQRKIVIELRNKLKPKIEISFNIFEQGCVISLPKYKAYRLKVANVGEERLTDCRGHLKSITCGQRKYDAQSLIMPFSPSELPESCSKTIVKGSPEFLDLFTIFEWNEIKIHCDKVPNGFDQQQFFGQPGQYIFDISVSSKEAPVAEYKLKMDWTGDWTYTDVRPAVTAP